MGWPDEVLDTRRAEKEGRTGGDGLWWLFLRRGIQKVSMSLLPEQLGGKKYN